MGLKRPNFTGDEIIPTWVRLDGAKCIDAYTVGQDGANLALTDDGTNSRVEASSTYTATQVRDIFNSTIWWFNTGKTYAELTNIQIKLTIDSVDAGLMDTGTEKSRVGVVIATKPLTVLGGLEANPHMTLASGLQFDSATSIRVVTAVNNESLYDPTAAVYPDWNISYTSWYFAPCEQLGVYPNASKCSDGFSRLYNSVTGYIGYDAINSHDVDVSIWDNTSRFFNAADTVWVGIHFGHYDGGATITAGEGLSFKVEYLLNEGGRI